MRHVFRHSYWICAKVVARKTTIPKTPEKSRKMCLKRLQRKTKLRKKIQFRSLIMWTTLWIHFLLVFRCTSTNSSIEIPIDSMCTVFTTPITPSGQFLKTRLFCSGKSLTNDKLQMTFWTQLCLNFLWGNWKNFVQTIASHGMIIWEWTFLRFWNTMSKKECRTTYNQSSAISWLITMHSLHCSCSQRWSWQQKKDMLANSAVWITYIETHPGTFIIPSKINQFISENSLINASVHLRAIATNAKSAFSKSYTENPFWYQQCHLGQARMLIGNQLVSAFDPADNCCFVWYDTGSS